MKKLVAFFLVFSLLGLSESLLAEERHGMDIAIYMTKPKMEGTPFEKPDIRGELTAAKVNSLLILDSRSGVDIAVGIEDVKVIKIMKKSKTWRGAILGLMIGGVAGGALGSSPGGDFASLWALAFGIGAGIVGAITGAIIASSPGVDESIRFEGRSDAQIQETLERLGKKARVRNFQ